jgi:SNF2 family DNA or RNA helicase
MNYEKNHFDLDLLKERIKGQRVLFILDEVQKALHPNLAYKGFNRLRKSVKNSLCWAFSASTSDGDPLRTWRLYSFLAQNPLGTQEQFREEYLAERRLVNFGKGRFTYIDVWNEEKLKEIPARVARWTHIVRKSDPGIRKYFKNTDFIIESVQLSDHSRETYSILEELAQLDSDKISRVQLFNAMRYCCNTLEGFNYSDNEIAKLMRSYGFSFNSEDSNKFEQIVEKIEQIREQGDKVVVFTQWTNLSLFPLSRILKKNKINHVTHYGSGMSSAQAQQAQDTFKQDKDITVFLSSDAGSHGLNFQEARYVIHVEPPHSYDLLTQRSDRIDRIDSYYDNLTSYLFLAKDTVEERVWQVNDYRRRITQNIQGTTESISRPPVLDVTEGLHDPRQARWLLTGEEVNG